MTTCEVDALVAFSRVRVVSSTAAALHCEIGDRRVWLPREHIKGRLWSPGDCGTLLIRRWVALDRQLTVPDAPSGAPDYDAASQGLPARRLRLLAPRRPALGD